MAVTGESPIFGPPSITEKRFVNSLRAAKSPAADEGASIYRRMVNNGFDPLIALGQFQAESGLGTKGHATSTRNWGNILFYEWTKALGAVEFAPGNGFHYSEFPTWTQGARAYIRLMKRYESRDFDTVEKMAAHWLGDKVGTPRTNRYVGNILQACARFAAPPAIRATRRDRNDREQGGDYHSQPQRRRPLCHQQTQRRPRRPRRRLG